MAIDRHNRPGYLYRPDPSDLLERVDALHGPKKRAEVIDDLLEKYLAGGRMPRPGAAGKKRDKVERDHSA